MVAEGAKMTGKITPEGIAAMRARIGVLIPEPTPYNLEASLDSIRHFTYGSIW